MTPEVLLDGLVFPESPRWHDGELWVSDIFGERVVAVTPEGRSREVLALRERPSGLGFMPDGSALIASRRDQRIRRLASDGLHPHADLSGLPGERADDMVVDAEGRAYVNRRNIYAGSGEPTRPSYIALVTPDGAAGIVADGLHHPNGMVITPDRSTLIVAETRGNRLSAFDISADGSLANGRVFAALGELTPDGICLDAEMGVWVGTVWSGGFIRVVEGGEITHRISTPGKWAVAPMLGGHDRKTLFLGTCQTTLLDCRTIETTGESFGWIETVRVDVPGAGWP